MNRHAATPRLIVQVLMGLALFAGMSVLGCSGEQSDNAGTTFADRVDLSQLGRAAIHDTGRFKSVDSFTHAIMQRITGPVSIDGQSDTFTYLDLLFRPSEYIDRAIIYVRKKPVRASIADAVRTEAADLRETAARATSTSTRGALVDSADALESRAQQFMKTGLISRRDLARTRVAELLARMQGDVIKTKRFADEIELAVALAHPQILERELRIVPAPGGDVETPWLSPAELGAIRAESAAANEHLLEISVAWNQLEGAWLSADVDAANAAVHRLTAALPEVNDAVYPASQRTGWPWTMDDESTAGWIASGGVLLALLGGACWLFRRGRGQLGLVPMGIGAAVVATLGGGLYLGQADWLSLESAYFRNYHWFTLIWIVYMFSVVFLLMSIVYRWRTARIIGLLIFVLAFALHTAGLLLRWYISDRWPNSNMFEAVTTAAWFGGCAALILEPLVRRTAMRNLFALGSAAASMTALMAAHFLPHYLNAGISNKMPVLDDVWLYIHTNVIIFSYCLIFMAAIVAMLYLAYRVAAHVGGFGGTHHFARVGGAGGLIMTRPDGETYLASTKTTIGQVFDGATMILMELSFILLWAGLVMGAIWADHSWGRPWGWDPKEVFALNTFIVFAVLVHVRLKVKDKGLWSALLVIAGCIVMLFNWIFINFKISGLHSYA